MMNEHQSRRRALRVEHPFVAEPIQNPVEVALVQSRWEHTLPLYAAVGELPDSATASASPPMRHSRRGWLGLLALLATLAGCAALPPESMFGYSTLERWEASKRERLGDCSRDPTITTRKQALHCLGTFKEHRGTPACTDSSAWVSRVAAGIEPR